MDDAQRIISERARAAAKARWDQTPRKPVVVKSLRVDPEIWAKVAERAAFRQVTPNDWLVRCIKDGLKKAEEAK